MTDGRYILYILYKQKISIDITCVGLTLACPNNKVYFMMAMMIVATQPIDNIDYQRL